MAKKTKQTKENTRAKIIAAAFSCYSKRGVSMTTLSNIAREAKVSHPLLIYYYPNLENLEQDVVTQILESLRDTTLKAITPYVGKPVEALKAYIEAPFRWALDHPDKFTIWMYFYYLASRKLDFQKMNSLIRTTGRERIRAIIYEGLSKSNFKLPQGFTVEQIDFQVQSLISGAVIQACTEATSAKERKELLKAQMTLTSSLILRLLAAELV